MLELSVPKQHAGKRLDQFLVSEVPRFSRSRIQQLIKNGHALLNGGPAKPGAAVREGDMVTLDEPPPAARARGSRGDPA